MRHAPRGACELKLVMIFSASKSVGHAPRGACELKCNLDIEAVFMISVTPREGRVS